MQDISTYIHILLSFIRKSLELFEVLGLSDFRLFLQSLENHVIGKLQEKKCQN